MDKTEEELNLLIVYKSGFINEHEYMERQKKLFEPEIQHKVELPKVSDFVNGEYLYNPYCIHFDDDISSIPEPVSFKNSKMKSDFLINLIRKYQRTLSLK